MGDLKIARTVFEAQAGDLLWYCSPQRNRYGPDGRYEGRGVWTVQRVKEVGRLSVTVGNTKFARDTGEMRGNRSGLSGQPYVRGSVERAAGWWRGRANSLAEKVRQIKDPDILRTVAFALGEEGTPDFSKIPAAQLTPTEASHA